MSDTAILTLGILLVTGLGLLIGGWTKRQRSRTAHLAVRFERTGYGSGHVAIRNQDGASANDVRVRTTCPNGRGLDPMRGIPPERFRTPALPVDAEMIVPVAFYPEAMSPPIEVHIEWTDKAGRHTSMIPVSWSQ